MAATLKTRKPIDELTVEDLSRFPIWEYTTDEEDEEDEDQDETWVRPIEATTIPLNAYSLSVAATFTTASGMKIHGLIGISTDNGVEIGGGAMLYQDRYLFVPSPDFVDAAKVNKQLAKALGLSLKDVFPLKFAVGIPITGHSECIQGVFNAKP